MPKKTEEKILIDEMNSLLPKNRDPTDKELINNQFFIDGLTEEDFEFQSQGEEEDECPEYPPMNEIESE